MKIKKKLKKYGDGGNTKEKEKISKSFTEANDFLKNWQQSPMYNELLNNSTNGSEYSKISNYRNKALNLNPVSNLNVEKTLLNNPHTTGFVRKGIPIVNISSDWHNHNEMLSNLKTESDSLKVRLGETPDYKIPNNFVTPSTIVHEMSHITDWKGLPKRDLQKIKAFSSDREKNKFSNYVANPSETRSRLNEIRYENSLLKYYNPFTEKINKEQYNKYLEDKSKGNALKDLKNVYSDDEIIDMLNSISENNQLQEQIPIAKNGGKNVNTLEGDLYSKVLMNRNKNLDFVQRANAVGQYPESNMFQQFDPNEFGQKNSHLMEWGEDENGQAYMLPSIFNDKNESIKVPNQYVDYISSIGYKHATGIPTKQNGGSLNKYPNGGRPQFEWSKKDMTKTYPVTQTQNNSSITTGNKKLSTEELKKAAEYTKKYNQQHLEEEYNNRQNKLKQSIDAQKQPLSLKNLQTQTQSTGDKFSLAMNSKYGNPKDYPTLSGYMQGLDYINPAKMIGDMTSGLGSVPQDVNNGNYLKAGLSVASPLAVGAIAGVGANSVKPFVNNLVNPLAGTGEVINNLGNKYLPNAYKLNPNAFKPNPNNFYRQVDTPTFNEGLESGLIRGKQDIGYSDESAMKMFGDDAYYNKGRLYYKNEKDYPYLFEANLPEDRFIPKVNGRTRKYTTENTRVRVSKEPLPINDPNIKTYKKDWLKGYKQIEVPKKEFGGNITRESEWELVNEDLPKAGNGLSLVKTLTPIGNKVIPRNPSLYKDAINNVDKIEHNINDRYRVQADDFTDKNYPTDYDEDSGHNDYVDALRHSATAMYTTSGQGNFLAPLKVPYTNVMGLAHELKGLGSYVSNPDKLTWQGAKQQLRETGSDLYNNFVGSMIGGLPINIENKEKILKFAKDKNILSDLSKKQNGGKLPKRRLNLNKSSDWEIVD